MAVPADSHMRSVNGRLEGQNKEQSERAEWGTGGGGVGGQCHNQSALVH